MSHHAMIYFLGRYRPAVFSGLTPRHAARRALAATANMEPAERQQIAGWIASVRESAERHGITGAGIEHGQLGFSIRAGRHDGFLDRVTRDMPHCPGLDYSKIDNH